LEKRSDRKSGSEGEEKSWKRCGGTKMKGFEERERNEIKKLDFKKDG